MTKKTFAQKIQSAQQQLGGMPKLYATLDKMGAWASITSLWRWVGDNGNPHPNNLKIIEAALDEILAAKTGK